MDPKKFSQEEVNRIVALRVKREQERMTKEFENKMKRCMASIHLMLHQEMCTLKRDLAAETREALLPPIGQQTRLDQSCLAEEKNETKGGEQQ